jgi:hypothetical protein
MSSEQPLIPARERSTFVTVLAWIFLVLAGFATIISILQNVMIHFMVPVEEMRGALQSPGAPPHLPAAFGFIFSNIRLFFLGFLVVSCLTLVSSIGLLMRKNWARILFMVLMALGIGWNLAGIVLQVSFFSSIPRFPEQGMETQFHFMMNVMQGFSIFMAVGISVLLGWIIKRLCSEEIKAEFGTRPWLVLC